MAITEIQVTTIPSLITQAFDHVDRQLNKTCYHRMSYDGVPVVEPASLRSNRSLSRDLDHLYIARCYRCNFRFTILYREYHFARESKTSRCWVHQIKSQTDVDLYGFYSPGLQISRAQDTFNSSIMSQIPSITEYDWAIPVMVFSQRPEIEKDEDYTNSRINWCDKFVSFW